MSKHERIKEERKRLGYTQQDIADLCDVHRVQWGRYERGVQGFDGQPLRKFGELGADISYILTGTHTPQVELDVNQKLSQAIQQATQDGNTAGADNLTLAKQEMQQATQKRAENHNKRADELDQIIRCLLDMDDDTFDRTSETIKDIWIATCRK